MLGNELRNVLLARGTSKYKFFDCQTVADLLNYRWAVYSIFFQNQNNMINSSTLEN